MRSRRFIPWAALCAATVLAACGGAASPANTPATGQAAGSEAAPDERASGDDWGSTEGASEAPACFAKCGELIERADKLFAQAEARPEGAPRTNAFERAGDAYVLAWRGCSLSIPHGEDLGCPGARQVVPRMAESFTQGDDIAKHVFALLVARDRRWRPDGAGKVDPSTLQSVAGKAETAANENPKDPGAVEALEAATYARIAAGDAQKAEQDLRRYERVAPKEATEPRVLMAVALAAFHNDAGQHQRALQVLGRPPVKQPPRVVVLWHAEQGRAHAGLSREGAAKGAFAKALDAWKQLPADGSAEHFGRAMPWPMQGRERVVESVGAAYFHAGEVLRARAASMPFPRYRGPKSVQGVTSFVNDAIGPYIRERQKVMLEAEAAYQKVAEIKPVAPPRYVVASAAAMGSMYADLARDVVESPIPPHIADDEDVATGYRKTLEQSMEPLVQKARRAFTTCSDTARDLRLEGEVVERCERWLRDHPGS